LVEDLLDKEVKKPKNEPQLMEKEKGRKVTARYDDNSTKGAKRARRKKERKTLTTIFTENADTL